MYPNCAKYDDVILGKVKSSKSDQVFLGNRIEHQKLNQTTAELSNEHDNFFLRIPFKICIFPLNQKFYPFRYKDRCKNSIIWVTVTKTK